MDHLGADTRTRTGDLRITNALLYQLSHVGRLLFNRTEALREKRVQS